VNGYIVFSQSMTDIKVLGIIIIERKGVEWGEGERKPQPRNGRSDIFRWRAWNGWSPDTRGRSARWPALNLARLNPSDNAVGRATVVSAFDTPDAD